MKSDKLFALKLAEKAGNIMRSNFRYGMKKKNKVEDFSPVTEADLEINQLVIDEVKKQYPGYGVLAEEKNFLVKNSKFVWVCDPIDGTIPFSHGLPISTFSLALVKDGQPVVGVIYDPFHNNYFFAAKGKGAQMNGKKIKVSRAKRLEGELVLTEHWKQAAYDTIKTIDALEDLNCHTSLLKSIAIGGALVAAGEAIGVICPGKTPWDMAAAKIIIEEAGGKVTDITGQEQRYDRNINGCFGSNAAVHQKLLKIINKTVIKNKSYA